jgi:ADP-heptose:LPS heptosyltransferase
MRSLQLDLVLQLHGSGGIVNPLVASFGARCTAGLANAQAWRPDADVSRYAAWREQGSEIERLLALTDHLGLARQGLQLDFPLQPADRECARALLAEPGAAAAQAPYAVVHAGSQLPSRRWPPQRFAEVADALAAQGLQVLLTGSSGEAGLTAAVAQAMRHPARDLAGRTDLWTLGALIEGAALLVCNDTGVSHIAAATSTPSVVVANGSDVSRWAPADTRRHRVFWHDIACRPCAETICPHGQACALAVEAAPVRDAALEAAQAADSASARGGGRSSQIAV